MTALVLLGMLLGVQDPSDLEALFDRLASLDPEVRASARVRLAADLEPQRESLRRGGAAGTVALAFLGDASTRKELAKLLSHEKSAVLRGAAEAAG
ncbi:MAG TPA: hypothetical protein VEN81_03475, partial [Planctomycetota bacterium]|nr:hypothetical protein [Planctomycetota bacterium]